MEPLSLIAARTRPRKKFWAEYCPVYERLFARRRELSVTVLELGIGGYDNPTKGGESLRMWAEYFPHGTIVGVDRYEKHLDLPGNASAWRASQTDVHLLNRIATKYGGFDVVIDDASHVTKKTIRSFEILWPRVKPGGCYVVEDLYGTYGQAHKPGNTATAEYFTRIGAELLPNMCVVRK